MLPVSTQQLPRVGSPARPGMQPAQQQQQQPPLQQQQPQQLAAGVPQDAVSIITAQLAKLAQQGEANTAMLNAHITDSVAALRQDMQNTRLVQDQKIAENASRMQQLENTVKTLEAELHALRLDQRAQQKHTLWHAASVADASARKLAVRTRVVRVGAGAPAALTPHAVLVGLREQLGASMEDAWVLSKDSVAVRTRADVRAKERVPAAASAIDRANLRVGGFRTDLEMQRMRVAKAFCEQANAQQVIAQQCVFHIHMGRLHVRRAGTPTGTAADAGAGPSGSGVPHADPATAGAGADASVGVPYTHLYEHVNVGSDGRLALEDLDADHILGLVGQLFSLPRGQGSERSSGGMEWEQVRNNRRRSREGAQQRSDPGAAAATPPPDPKRPARPALDAVGTNLLAQYSYGDAEQRPGAADAGPSGSALPGPPAPLPRPPHAPRPPAPPPPPPPPPARPPASPPRRPSSAPQQRRSLSSDRTDSGSVNHPAGNPSRGTSGNGSRSSGGRGAQAGRGRHGSDRDAPAAGGGRAGRGAPAGGGARPLSNGSSTEGRGQGAPANGGGRGTDHDASAGGSAGERGA